MTVSASRSSSERPLRLARGMCAAVVVIAATNWIGWATGHAILTSLLPDSLPMRPWTALWLALLTASALLQVGRATTRARMLLARSLAVVVALFAVYVFTEYARGGTYAFDVLWFHDAVQRTTLAFPGRPSQQTVVPTLCLAITTLLLRIEGRAAMAVRLAGILLGTLVPFAAMLSYLLGDVVGLEFQSPVLIAPSTVLAMTLLSLAVVLGRPHGAPYTWFREGLDRPGLLRLTVVAAGYPLGVYLTHEILTALGADNRTADVLAALFSAVLVAVGLLVVSAQRARLLIERAALADELRMTTERYRLLAENASDLVVSLSVGVGIDWVSPSVRGFLGFEPQHLIGKHAHELFHPADAAVLEHDRPLVLAGHAVTSRLRLVDARGAERWCEVTTRPLFDDEQVLQGAVLAVRNIEAEMAARAAFEHEVQYDALTGLQRREPALERIHEILTEGTGAWALLCVGVNGMTQINQAYTYSTGDAVLQTVAERLVEAVGAHDRVARIAGDEFVVLEPDLVSATGAASAAERILSAIRGEIEIDGQTIEVSASIGIAMAADDDAEGLLRDATAAMRQASLRGPNRWEFLDGNIGAQTRTALTVQSELRSALASSGIEAWLMPVVRLSDREVEGYEVLVRWRREDGSIWAPDLFLDIAERSGLILDLDREMFRQTVQLMARAPRHIVFAYNVSAASLSSEGFAEWVRAELTASGVDPRRLHFEITETALFHVTRGIEQSMESLAALGIEWWVDDFGTGFSSISHLRDLPIAGLKLDKSFTADIVIDAGASAALAEGLLGLANGLHLGAIAEGVETDEQEALLLRQGWPHAQGWRYGRPAPAPW